MGLIALMTDFGNRDPYVAIMKGVIKRINPGVEIADVAHELPPFRVLPAAYSLYNTYKWYPPGTVFGVVIDPGVGTDRRAIVAKTKNYWFVAPDNGVLSPVLKKASDAEVYVVDEEELNRVASGEAGLTNWNISSTFHGRDVFAPATALISKYGRPGKWVYPVGVDELVEENIFWEKKEKSEISYKVVNIDRFGNVALSTLFSDSTLKNFHRVIIRTNEGILETRRVKTFGEAEVGELIFYENSFGFLEIAINQDNASKQLGVDIGDVISFRSIS
ncbi:MAG: S-adenosyl-l-methionine hydroxide adenosyltransferase family protein [Desulfurococcales archaeon]|nr:S-adenosyl-l-methionine hydroxide adenosyltransferase family protein [Desulfurococcales archaeon]